MLVAAHTHTHIHTHTHTHRGLVVSTLRANSHLHILVSVQHYFFFLLTMTSMVWVSFLSALKMSLSVTFLQDKAVSKVGDWNKQVFFPSLSFLSLSLPLSSSGCLPKEVIHVGVRSIDGTKSRENAYNCDPNHTYSTDRLLNGKYPCMRNTYNTIGVYLVQ